MRFVGRGHEAIRATHGKTLELAPGPDLTERGTCIVAVDADAQPPAPMAGPVRIRLAVAGERFAFEALANPAWDPSGPVVVRRGSLRLPGTFATGATAAADDLPRALVSALQDPDALVTVDVVGVPSDHEVLVLFAADPLAASASAALSAELDRADEVIAEDADARRLAGPTRGTSGGRTLVVATRDLPGSSRPDRPGPTPGTGGVVDTVGLPASLAVAAACPSRGPLTFVADAADVRAAPATHRVVLTVGRADLTELLHRARDQRGSGEATVMQDHGRPLPASPDAVPVLPGATAVAVCLHPAPAATALDPAVRAAITALLADGVPTKTTARALAALTGWERRRAYAAVIDWPSAT